MDCKQSISTVDRRIKQAFKSFKRKALRVLKAGSNYGLNGTYVHPKLIPHIAAWISPKFAIYISEIIDRWCALSKKNRLEYWNTLGDCVINHSSESHQEEKKWQQYIAARENGEIEVEIETGRIDVLTASKVIEVKRAQNWKHAVGQVLIYQEDFKSREAVICLFDCGEVDRDLIKRRCEPFNIAVEFLD